MPHLERKNLILDLILILLTAGIWNVWMQYRQIRDFNTLQNVVQYSFFKWLILTVITFGLYHIYHEYKLTRDLWQTYSGNQDGLEVGLIAGLVSATGAWIFVDLYQQSVLNAMINKGNIAIDS